MPEDNDGESKQDGGGGPAESEETKAVKPDNADTTPPGTVVDEKARNGVAHSEPSGEESSISEKAFVDRIRTSDRWMIWLTAALVMASLLQWCELHSSGVDTHNLADKTTDLANAASNEATAENSLSSTSQNQLVVLGNSVAVARQTAKAAQSAADAAEAQLGLLKAEQRPWVGLELIQNSPTVIAQQPFSISVFVKNFGRSPAFDVRICAASDTYGKWEQNEAGPTKLMGELKCPNNKTTTVLFPGADYALDVSRGANLITPAVERDVNSGVATVAAMGRIEYRANDGSIHHTEFCSIYDRASRLFRACDFGKFKAD